MTVNFLIPRVMPGNAVDTMMAQVPEPQPQAVKALEAEFASATKGTCCTSIGYLGNLAPPQPRDFGQSVSDKVTTSGAARCRGR